MCCDYFTICQVHWLSFTCTQVTRLLRKTGSLNLRIHAADEVSLLLLLILEAWFTDLNYSSDRRCCFLTFFCERQTDRLELILIAQKCLNLTVRCSGKKQTYSDFHRLLCFSLVRLRMLLFYIWGRIASCNDLSFHQVALCCAFSVCSLLFGTFVLVKRQLETWLHINMAEKSAFTRRKLPGFCNDYRNQVSRLNDRYEISFLEWL